MTALETKVGPKGYVHGWIFVGAPGLGDTVRHPAHGSGVVTAADGKHVTVRFASGEHTFGRAAGTGAARIVKRPEVPGTPAAGHAAEARSLAASARGLTPQDIYGKPGMRLDPGEAATHFDAAASHFAAGRDAEAILETGKGTGHMVRYSENAGKLARHARNYSSGEDIARTGTTDTAAKPLADRAVALHKAVVKVPKGQDSGELHHLKFTDRDGYPAWYAIHGDAARNKILAQAAGKDLDIAAHEPAPTADMPKGARDLYQHAAAHGWNVTYIRGVRSDEEYDPATGQPVPGSGTPVHKVIATHPEAGLKTEQTWFGGKKTTYNSIPLAKSMEAISHSPRSKYMPAPAAPAPGKPEAPAPAAKAPHLAQQANDARHLAYGIRNANLPELTHASGFGTSKINPETSAKHLDEAAAHFDAGRESEGIDALARAKRAIDTYSEAARRDAYTAGETAQRDAGTQRAERSARAAETRAHRARQATFIAEKGTELFRGAAGNQHTEDGYRHPETAGLIGRAQAAAGEGRHDDAIELLGEADRRERDAGSDSWSGPAAGILRMKQQYAAERNARGLARQSALHQAQAVHFREVTGAPPPQIGDFRLGRGHTDYRVAEQHLLAGRYSEGVAALDRAITGERSQPGKTTKAGEARLAKLTAFRDQMAGFAESPGQGQDVPPALAILRRDAAGTTVLDHAGREYQMTRGAGKVTMTHEGRTLSATATGDSMKDTQTARELAGQLSGTWMPGKPAPAAPKQPAAPKPAKLTASQQAKLPVIGDDGKRLVTDEYHPEVNEHLDAAARAASAAKFSRQSGDLGRDSLRQANEEMVRHLTAAQLGTGASTPLGKRIGNQREQITGKQPRLKEGESRVLAEGDHRGVHWQAVERGGGIGNRHSYHLTYHGHEASVQAGGLLGGKGPHEAAEKFQRDVQARAAAQAAAQAMQQAKFDEARRVMVAHDRELASEPLHYTEIGRAYQAWHGHKPTPTQDRRWAYGGAGADQGTDWYKAAARVKAAGNPVSTVQYAREATGIEQTAKAVRRSDPDQVISSRENNTRQHLNRAAEAARDGNVAQALAHLERAHTTATGTARHAGRPKPVLTHGGSSAGTAIQEHIDRLSGRR